MVDNEQSYVIRKQVNERYQYLKWNVSNKIVFDRTELMCILQVLSLDYEHKNLDINNPTLMVYTLDTPVHNNNIEWVGKEKIPQNNTSKKNTKKEKTSQKKSTKKRPGRKYHTRTPVG